MDIWNNTKVSICGCGWLGYPLADHLVQLGAQVWGSRQTVAAAEALSAIGVNGIPLCLPNDVVSPSQAVRDFFATDVLVVNVPPGRQPGSVDAWQQNVSQLLDVAQQCGTQRVIFISTTVVYGNAKGTVYEDTPVQPETASGQAHADMEQLVLQMWGDNAVVLRLSGLIGPGRHPVRFLSGRKAIPHGGDPVNLIHQADCIAAIRRIITLGQQGWGGHILHLAAHDHPSRSAYYCAMANQAGLPLPDFAPDSTAEIQQRDAKVIDAGRTCELLGLTLLNPHLMSLPPEI
ncbi:NAD-dependent epimerase/dehydratase family protein [Photobacterium aphoticum]|uniref:NAD-dependent epimerase/dehydratase domain-containing protein n=1 Tax=Photobacterium aphoticum TaxID=754436 RepID=A0A0J1JGY2_9GAMM|nr:NAD-dependent epimerase/dehydratase family protein [Photobacterium aphoticum]KLV01102.1 hypothetical protein ABT58_09865 [Photobacterium aphoticum]PSU57643.1 protein yeeZ precursor [Photobacterium aphoticum]GHA37806.1 NAD(P)-dependent oxidoreductase [Photobacterium aphoticum]